MDTDLEYMKGREADLERRLAACRRCDAGYVARPYAVTAIVSAYRAGALMEQCLADLEAQSLGNELEIVVVDAASPEDEGETVRRFQERMDTIRYIRTPERITVYAAWNLAIQAASGRHILPFSTNDRLHPETCKALAGYLDANPGVAMVFGDSLISYDPRHGFDDLERLGGAPMYDWPAFRWEHLVENNGVGPHPMWRRSVHAVIGWFREGMTALADQDFWLRLGRRMRIDHVPAVTGIYFVSPDALSMSAQAVREHEEIRRRFRAVLAQDKASAMPVIQAVRRLLDMGERSQALELLRRKGGGFMHLDEARELAARLAESSDPAARP